MSTDDAIDRFLNSQLWSTDQQVQLMPLFPLDTCIHTAVVDTPEIINIVGQFTLCERRKEKRCARGDRMEIIQC